MKIDYLDGVFQCARRGLLIGIAIGILYPFLQIGISILFPAPAPPASGPSVETFGDEFIAILLLMSPLFLFVIGAVGGSVLGALVGACVGALAILLSSRLPSSRVYLPLKIVGALVGTIVVWLILTLIVPSVSWILHLIMVKG